MYKKFLRTLLVIVSSLENKIWKKLYVKKGKGK